MIGKKTSVVTVVALAILFSGCASNEIGMSKDVNQESIYQQYSVEYSEGKEDTWVNAQFRFAGSKGTTLVLSEPAYFEVDAVKVKADSTKMGGAYYMTALSKERATGEHKMIYADVAGKQYRNTFSIVPFHLKEPSAAVSRLEPAEISFEAPVLRSPDYIELFSMDTDSSFSIQLRAGDPVQKLLIPAAQLQRQKDKKLSVYAVIYRHLSLQQQTKEGGELSIKQTCKPVTLEFQ